MSDWMPQVVRIEKVVKHPNADALEIATVMGDYPVIIKLGQYKVGDLAAYVNIDSIVPDLPEWYFLCPQAYEKYEDADGSVKSRPIGPKYPQGSVPETRRIVKAKKLRGIYSQGLLTDAPAGLKEGDSVVEALGLKKWEEEEEELIANARKTRGANAESPPKEWTVPYYDIEGVRKYLLSIKDNEEVVLTEKLHGSCSTFIHDGERLWCKSRNWFKKMDDEDAWWQAATYYGLAEKLSKFPMFAFYGELCGMNKGFRYNAQIVDGKLRSVLRFFDVWDVKAGRFLDYDDMVAMVKEAGLETVPELYKGPWLGKDVMYPYAEGMTTLGGKHVREGFVIKTVKERWEERLDNRLILKLVGEGYNLAK